MENNTLKPRKSFGEYLDERYYVTDFTGHLAVLTDSSMPVEDIEYSMSWLKQLYEDCVQYLSEDNAVRYRLNDTEYNALQEVASLSKMDVWFDLVDDPEGDYIYDREEDKVLYFKQGLGWLLEGIVEPTWSELSEEYQEAIIDLAKLFDLEFGYEPTIYGQELKFHVNGFDVFVQINSDNDFDYTIYKPDGSELDGGILENIHNYETIVPKVVEEIKNLHASELGII